MKNIFKYTLALLLVAGINLSCNDFLEPSLNQNLPTEGVIQNIDDLNATVLGTHSRLKGTALFGRDMVAGLEASSDNAFSNAYSGRIRPQSQFSHTVNSGYASGIWNGFYAVIANANVAIHADLESSPEVDHAKGQAYALRALAHMYLQLFFGQDFSGGSLGVPYITAYNDGNLVPERESSSDVWAKIGEDFTTAINLLDKDKGVGDPGIMNYYGARALQSRYFLFTGNYGDAVTAADDVIDNSGLSLVDAGSLEATWASGSGPAGLFEVAQTSTDRRGNDSLARIYRATNYGDVEATGDLYNAYDSDDARLELMGDAAKIAASDPSAADNIGDFRMLGKYVDELGSDNIRIIRLAEVILNKAEALARDNKEGQALPIINGLSADRGSNKVYTTGSIDEVLEERRLELAMEGHRFFDLLRNGKDIPFIGTGLNDFVTGSDISFGDGRIALPIPQAEMDANSSMEQNPFYK